MFYINKIEGEKLDSETTVVIVEGIGSGAARGHQHSRMFTRGLLLLRIWAFIKKLCGWYLKILQLGNGSQNYLQSCTRNNHSIIWILMISINYLLIFYRFCPMYRVKFFALNLSAFRSQVSFDAVSLTSIFIRFLSSSTSFAYNYFRVLSIALDLIKAAEE